MRVADIEAVAERLNGLAVPFVIVGGSALEREYDIGSGDIDLLVAVGDFNRLEKVFENRRDISAFEPFTTIGSAKFQLRSGWVDVEFINGRLFTSSQRGDDFVDYVRNYRSERRDSARWASPEVVWYMRLCIDDWKTYVVKIRRDINAGVPPSTLDAVIDVARNLGTEEKISTRVRMTRELLKLYR